MLFFRSQRKSMYKSTLKAIVAALLATSAFVEASGNSDEVVHVPTKPLTPGKERLSAAENPYGFNIRYEVAWLNKEQRRFGATMTITLKNPVEDAYWLLNFQFADNGTRIDQTWSPWNLTFQDDGLYRAVPLPVNSSTKNADGSLSRNYMFNGHYYGNNPKAILINGYRMSPSPKVPYKVLTKYEASNAPLSNNLSPVPIGEFNRQQRAAVGTTTTVNNGNSGNTASAATVAKNDGSDSSNTMVGMYIFCSVCAVGLTVVGIATYRRRRDRQEFRARQEARALERANTKTSFLSLAAQQESIAMPEPTAINNHSAAARAAAGAVVMEDMNAGQDATDEYYVMDDVAPEAHYQGELLNSQHDGVYYADYDGEYDAENHDAYAMEMHDGNGYYDDQMMQQGQGYDNSYVDGLSDYPVHYADQRDYNAMNQTGATPGNNAVEHVDLRPPVAQEYYVADPVVYDGEEQGLGLEPGMHNPYQVQMLDGTEEYQAFEATEFNGANDHQAFEPTEFNAAELDAQADNSHHQQQYQPTYQQQYQTHQN
jgi:hypothetical protein